MFQSLACDGFFRFTSGSVTEFDLPVASMAGKLPFPSSSRGRGVYAKDDCRIIKITPQTWSMNLSGLYHGRFIAMKFNRFFPTLLITACKRSCGEVMFFTGVCLSGGGGSGLPAVLPPGTINPLPPPREPQKQAVRILL